MPTTGPATMTPEQILHLYNLVRDYHLAFAISLVGPEAVAVQQEDVQRLVDAEILSPADALGLLNGDVFGNAVTLGVLRMHVEQAEQRAKRGWYPEDVNALSFSELEQRIKRDPIPMTEPELAAVSAARARAGSLIVNRGDRVAGDVLADIHDVATEGAVLQSVEVGARTVEDIVSEKTVQAIEERWTAGKLKSELGHRVETWDRDWDRIARTELQEAANVGVAVSISSRHGDADIARIPNPSACDKCKALYLGGDGIPIVRPLSWFAANGLNNFGRKQADWKATLGTVHPHCLPGNTLVRTARGEIPIERVVVGDFVLTANGRWRRVYQSMRRYYEGSMVEIRGTCGERILCTPNHAVLSEGEWKRADLLGDCVEIRTLSLRPNPNADDGPSDRAEILRLATVLFCLDRRGVPVSAVNFNGDATWSVREIHEPSSEEDVVLHLDSARPHGIGDDDFVSGVRDPSVFLQATSNLSISDGSSANCGVGCFRVSLTLRGSHAFVANLLGFASSPLNPPGFMNALDDAGSRHPDLAGYFEHAHLVVEVPFENTGNVDFDVRMHDESFLGYGVARSSSVEGWSGYVYNIGVSCDASYIAGGIAVSNCHCRTVRVPKGFALTDEWDVVPKGMISGKVPQLPPGDEGTGGAGGTVRPFAIDGDTTPSDDEETEPKRIAASA